MGNIGLQELLFLFVVAFVCIGPKRLPELARALGEAVRAFRRAMHETIPDGVEVTPKLPAEDIPRPPVEAEQAPPAATRE